MHAYVCVSVSVSTVQHPLGPGKDIRALAAGFTGVCELPRVSSHDWAASVLNCSSPIVALNIHIYLAANIFIYLAANAKTWSSWEGRVTTIDIQTLWVPLRGKENCYFTVWCAKGQNGVTGIIRPYLELWRSEGLRATCEHTSPRHT